MSAPDTQQRAAAERWFLYHGLPAVLRPGALLRRVWTRSAPALAAFGVMMASSVLIVAVTGKHTIDIGGAPTRGEWFALFILILVLPAAATVGRVVSRIESARLRGIASGVSMAVAVLGGLVGGPSPRLMVDLLIEGVVFALIFLCTATGIGSITGWAVRVTVDNLALAGSLLARARYR